MIKIGIVDDEVIICETLSKYLKELGYAVPEYAINYEEGLKLIKEHNPDIMLLDINLKNGKGGIDIAKHIRQYYNIPLIFISSYSDKQTIEQAKEVKPNGYLLKPFTKNDLFASIEVAISNYGNKTITGTKEQANNLKFFDDAIFIKQDNLFIKIKLAEIQYIKSEGVYAEIITEGRKYLIRETLKSILDSLPEKTFQQSHRSFIVNISFIEAVNQDYVIIKNENIPIGKSHRDNFLKSLHLI